MTLPTRSISLSLCLAATLALGACAQQEVPVAGSRTTSPAAAEDAPATAGPVPATSTPRDETEDDAPSSSAENADASETDAGGKAGLDVANDPEWTAPGQLVGVYGQVVVLEDEGPPGPGEDRGAVTLTAYRSDGTAAWERELTAPDALADADGATPDVSAGHRHVIVSWTGTPTGAGHGLLVSGVVDPATGEQLAGGEAQVPAGATISEQISYDEFFLSDGSTVLTVAADGAPTVDGGSDGYDEPAVDTGWRVTHDLGVSVGDDGHVQVVSEEGPIGDGGACQIEPGPGSVAPTSFSPSRDLALFPGVVVDLVGGGDGDVPVPGRRRGRRHHGRRPRDRAAGHARDQDGLSDARRPAHQAARRERRSVPDRLTPQPRSSQPRSSGSRPSILATCSTTTSSTIATRSASSCARCSTGRR